MKKIIAIMQPTYMPWLGYFAMIDAVEEFVFLDNVQLEGRSWQVRNKIKYGENEKLLTIPVCKEKHRDDRFICATSYSGTEWKTQHLEIIRNAYKKSLYYDSVMPFLEELYNADYNSIGEMNEKFITSICAKIGITTPFFYSNEMNATGHKDILLVDICKKRNASEYLSAQGSGIYIEAGTPAGSFAPNKIALYYQNYEHPEYHQMGKDFVPYIGIYDLLFNEGFDNALKIIRSGKRESIPSYVFRMNYLKCKVKVGYIGNYYKIPEYILHSGFDLSYVIIEKGKMSDEMLTFLLVRNIPFCEVSNSVELINEIGKSNISVWITCSYGKRIPVEKLEKTEIYNIHYAALPYYKGRHPTFYATMADENEIGITLHKITSNLDEGTIIAQRKLPYYIWENENDIFEKLSEEVPVLLDSLLKFLHGGKLDFKIVNSEGYYYPPVCRNDFTIELEKDTPTVIYNKVRAQAKYNGALLSYGGTEYWVHSVRFSENESVASPDELCIPKNSYFMIMKVSKIAIGYSGGTTVE